MNKIGGKFFSPEWFDLDREGNMMENPNKTPTPDDWHTFEDEFDKRPGGLECPYCHSHDTVVKHDIVDEGTGKHTGYFVSCQDCGRRFEKMF